MAGNSALGGFVEGLQGGITHRQQSKRNKKIDRMLDQEAEIQAMAIKGKQNSINKTLAAKGMAPMDFAQFGADQDPYDFKLGDFFRPKKLWQNFKNNTGIGGGQPLDNPASPAIQNEAAIGEITDGADASSLGMQGSTDNMNLMNAADGGSVRRMRMADGGSASTEAERIREARQRNMRARAEYVDKARAGTGDAPNRLAQTPKTTSAARQAVSTGSRLNPRITAAGTRRVLGAAARKAPGIGAAISTADALMDQGELGYDERMNERFGDWGWGTPGEASFGGAAEFGIKRALGFASDLGDALTFGQASRLYRDERDSFGLGPDEKAAVKSSDVMGPPEPEVAPTAAQPATGPATAGAPPQAPTRDPQQAIAAATANGPNQLADMPVTDPGEMPTMNTEEWVAYRATAVEDLLLQGMTLPEAHDAITKMQQQGFLNYGTQALQMLAAGDALHASMALKAAYQYFPNGVDVKFGMTKDKSGQPALIAMGLDEQTGEPVGNGPMIVNGERLAVMMEQMSNPDAFRTWTKDWREFEQDLRKYYEVEKPQAESENIYRDRLGRAAIGKAQADLYGAQFGGGLKQSDLDRAYAAMEKRLNEIGLMENMPPQDQDYLYRVAAIAYEADPGNYPNTVAQIVMMYRDGGKEAVDQWMRSGE